jgi:hypothetical protein
MKFTRQLLVGDVVGLLGLHYGLPLLGIVRAIDGDVVAVHHTTGVFPNTRTHETIPAQPCSTPALRLDG